MKYSITAFILLTCIQSLATDESPLWRSAVITNEQGLSNSAVNSVFRDSRGFMWFGTWDGLNRYDGKNIKTFYPDMYDENAISNNIIREMMEDAKGNMWIVTERGLNRYSHDLETFNKWFYEDPGLALREHSLKAGVDQHDNIWVKVHGLGLFYFDPLSERFSQFLVPCLSDSEMQQIDDFFLFENDLFLLQHDSVFVIDKHAGRKTAAYSLSGLSGIKEDLSIDRSWFFNFRENPFLIAALREGGMLILDLSMMKVDLLHAGDPSYQLTACGLSACGDYFWLGTDDGNILQMFPDESFSLQAVLHLLPELADKKVKIWSILETADDLLWIGTDGEGVFRVILKPKPFFQIGRGEAADRQLNHQIVRAIHEDGDGNLWVGTRGNGLNFIPAQKGRTRYYNTSNGLTNNAVLSIEKDRNGLLWIGHDGSGIDVLDLSTGRFLHFPDNLEGADHLSFGSVYDICIDTFGQVWLGTSGYGVIGLNIKREGDRFKLISYKHVSSETAGQALRSNIVYAIVEERPNILWLATRGAGVYRMNTLTGTLENHCREEEGRGLIDNDILSLHMGHDDHLWVGSSGGLNKINLSYTPYAISHFTSRDGLPNNTIHAILEDREGNVWTSTNKGLSKFIREGDTFLNFNSADGLQGNEYTDGAAHDGQTTGRFYFGGTNGLDWFYPESITISDRMPQLMFNELRLFNQVILPGDSTLILSRNINDLDKIVLKHHQNFFTVGFTTLNFINPDKSIFEYKLEGFNTDWVLAGKLREANFTNVPDGKYRLLVRATNEDGIWSDETKELIVIIKPPFWKTWPAFMIYALVLALIIYLFYRYQTGRIRRKQKRAMEKMQQQKEKELHQYKLQFFTNLAHEFGTPLTLIFASAGSLLNPTQKPEEARSLIKTIYQNSRRMQKLIQELLEFRKIDTGREKLKLRKLDIVQSLNNIVNIFLHFAQEHELELIFEPDEEELWLMLDAGKLEKIMLNLLSNAIKFTPPGGIIKVSFHKNNNDVVIRVTDTGHGISDDVLPYVFDSYYQRRPKEQKNTASFQGIGIGLAYTKSLVELLGGRIDVNSMAGKGSTFTITLPCLTADDTVDKTLDDRNLLTANDLQKSISAEFKDGQSHGKAKTQIKPNLWTTPRKYRVLVAEDDPELSGFLYKMLSEQYDVSSVRDGKEALEVIGSKRVDIVVSDIIMPEMDGLQLCKTIKSDPVTSHIPVILLTARAEMENRIEGLEMGADSYIPKPFHPRHLFIRVEKLLKGREQLTEYFKQHFGTPAYELKQEYSTRDRELLEKCVKYIEAKCADENMDAEMLASHLAFSKPQLYRKVKALTGLTPHGLIKNFRLKKARQMIAEGKYSITDIIYMTGFNNRTYFYRSYKEAFGETPGVLNKQFQ